MGLCRNLRSINYNLVYKFYFYTAAGLSHSKKKQFPFTRHDADRYTGQSKGTNSYNTDARLKVNAFT